jgi:hypothetical protein
MTRFILLVTATVQLIMHSSGFIAPGKLLGRKPSFLRDTWEGASNGSGGRIEQIEFKIFPDGT